MTGNQTQLGSHVEANYKGLPFGKQELVDAMRRTYDELIDYITTDEFSSVLKEMSSLTSAERPQFVISVLLNESERNKRGIQPPDGILIQRSAFGDRRPTLFVVKKFLPEHLSHAWENVNITFDNEFSDESVSRKAEIAWRSPLDVNLQARLMTEGKELEDNLDLP